MRALNAFLWGWVSGIVSMLAVIAALTIYFPTPDSARANYTGNLPPSPYVDVRPYVVRVQVNLKNISLTMSRGHGAAYDAYRIMTNKHVVEGVDAAVVQVFINGSWRSADRVVRSANHDVAMIEFNQPHGIPVANMRGVPPIGEPVFYYNAEEGRVVSGVTRNGVDNLFEVAKDRFVTSSLPIRLGDSGGAVFDAYGNIVGMMTRTAMVGDGAPPQAYQLHTQLLRQEMLDLMRTSR